MARTGRKSDAAGIAGTSPTVPALGPGAAKVRFVVLTTLVRLALPPLFLSSIPKKAVGFSYPSGSEGKLLGAAVLGMTLTLAYALFPSLGVGGALIAAWLTGGTGALIVYNSFREKVAFLKPYCSTCRLRPVIEEHEEMHLQGVWSEKKVWDEASKKYSFASLGLADDPKICSFCPIAKKLRSYQ